MTLLVKPVDFLRGHINLPSSKSYSIRAFLIASCGGISRIINPSDCDDARVAMRVARQLGSKITISKKNVCTVVANFKKIKSAKINVGESGTALRFLLPLAALRGDKIKITGEGTLRGRPNLFLTTALRKMGLHIKGAGLKESVPIEITGGKLCGGKVAIDGSLSSQFISALLIACPALKEDTLLSISGKKIVSKTYITMTEQILKKAGVRIIQKTSRAFFIKGNQKFRGLKNFQTPSDYGLAAFFLAAASLVKSDIILDGVLRDDLIQSDAAILPLLKRMGVRFTKTDRQIKISGPFKLKGGQFSLKNCPDLVPIMAVMALFARGKTRLYDIGHARAKESDRISDLRNELLKIGANVKEGKNELTVSPKENYKHNVALDPHRDHRLAMSFAVLGLRLGARVADIECTKKSYPRFVLDFKKIRAQASKK